MAQRISAGRGIRHSELNASGYLDGKKLRVVQAWLPPDDLGAAPSHDEVDLNDALTDGTLVPVASGTPGLAPLTIGTTGATLRIDRVPAGRTIDVPLSRFTHFFVACGSASFGDETLYDGDVARITADGSNSADSDEVDSLPMTAINDAEVLAWTMDRSID
ncbi:hypothetical protein I6H48_07365 [Corynebacterium amycolatum]|uniref:Uncharacterized protein n=1 Tax=Corynebacterium amycolatum TaxID=43765 RepID=A0AB37GB52_CORAY|nr:MULTISPECIES: hypothetical protein [Corynebacterium]MBC6761916.1 hypothetical protein [Corynebacterium sp. LK27]MCQ9128502.1 hypothetical protein [Corynebacterium amycolatum]MCQ9142884.1 hypothetical protein [Corynebacterium amycolatum]MDK7110704.1 hypothetical protein [Corynebacterium amycolatum]MDK7145901.1 hypothetical protein [Corynebacterium amycolatum]